MAGATKEEFPPLLPAGFHQIDPVGRHRLCVDRFPASVTRPRIMKNIEAIVAQINQHGIQGDIWVDGSFLTEKLNPDDADVALVISADVLRTLDASQRGFFNTFKATSLYDAYRIDNYGVAIDSNNPSGEWLYAYWLRQFGFSRTDKPKGILKITVPFTVKP